MIVITPKIESHAFSLTSYLLHVTRFVLDCHKDKLKKIEDIKIKRNMKGSCPKGLIILLPIVRDGQ